MIYYIQNKKKLLVTNILDKFKFFHSGIYLVKAKLEMMDNTISSLDCVLYIHPRNQYNFTDATSKVCLNFSYPFLECQTYFVPIINRDYEISELKWNSNPVTYYKIYFELVEKEK